MYLHIRLAEFFPNSVTYSVFLYRRVNSLLNVIETEFLCLRETSINLNNLFTFFYAVLLLLSVYFFISFFILMLLQHLCLFVDQVNKSIVFVFGAFFLSFLYRYIRNWSLKPSVRIIDLVSHTIFVVCISFIRELRDLQFKVGSERHIFLGIFSCWEENTEKILLVFCFDVWPGACTLALCLISQHTCFLNTPLPFS